MRTLSVAWMPALAMEMVCCSMTSWMAIWSPMSILSNSSMAQMSLSANMSASASMVNSPVSSSDHRRHESCCRRSFPGDVDRARKKRANVS